jgi:hypothetical protein
MNQVILIVGAATSGKSSLARALLQAGHVADVISCDAHRFEPGPGWVKRPAVDYVRSVQDAVTAAIAAHPEKRIAVDTTVYDSSDPEDARGRCARHLCSAGFVVLVINLVMHQSRVVEGILTRSMRRAKGLEPQNSAGVETPASVARLLAKNWDYDAGVKPNIVKFIDEIRAGETILVHERAAVALPSPWDAVLHDGNPWSHADIASFAMFVS